MELGHCPEGLCFLNWRQYIFKEAANLCLFDFLLFVCLFVYFCGGGGFLSVKLNL